MPFNMGAPELILILVIALVVFGPGKLPDIGGAIGKSLREFRKASSDLTGELNREVNAVKQATSLETKIVCAKCGGRSEVGAKYCGQCGAELAARA